MASLKLQSSLPRRTIIAIGIVALVFVTWTSALGTDANAGTREKLDATESQIAKSRETSGLLTSEIEAMGAQIAGIESQVASLRQEESAAEIKLAAKQAELDRSVRLLDTSKAKLERTRQHLKRALKALADQLVAMYQTGTPDMATIALTAEDFGSMVSAGSYLESIRSRDEVLAQRVRSLRDQVQRTVQIRQEAKITIETARDAIATEEEGLQATRVAAESRQVELETARAGRRASLASVKGEIQQHEEVAADLRAKIETEISAATSTGTTSSSTSTPSNPGGFIWPIEGTLSSPFGSRWGSVHEGIDISAPEGTPIKAAASGTVILMQDEASSGGYGNYTCVDHGGGISTCYAHQSAFGTEMGASVRQGEVIGYVGNTGHSFGAHLHFEVRINGTATDPMGYL